MKHLLISIAAVVAILFGCQAKDPPPIAVPAQALEAPKLSAVPAPAATAASLISTLAKNHAADAARRPHSRPTTVAAACTVKISTHTGWHCATAAEKAEIYAYQKAYHNAALANHLISHFDLAGYPKGPLSSHPYLGSDGKVAR